MNSFWNARKQCMYIVCKKLVVCDVGFYGGLRIDWSSISWKSWKNVSMRAHKRQVRHAHGKQQASRFFQPQIARTRPASGPIGKKENNKFMHLQKAPALPSIPSHTCCNLFRHFCNKGRSLTLSLHMSPRSSTICLSPRREKQSWPVGSPWLNCR